MSPNRSEVDELSQAVRDDPANIELRGKLVEALLVAGDLGDADAHVEALVMLAPEMPWVLQLDAQVADGLGDTLRSARSRRRHRELLSLEQGPADAPPGAEGDTKPHPSFEQRPNFTLLTGGASLAARRSPTHKLEDVAGLATVKSYIRDLVADVRNAEPLSSGPWLGGALFYGPPGCGKKFCASVVAGELEAQFVILDLSESWTPARLTQMLGPLLDDAGAPKVLLLDNLDDRSGDDHASAIESALWMLDRARAKNTTIILGSATLPWAVSRKLATPGKLDKIILMLPPDQPARKLFLQRLTTEEDLEVEAEDIDWLTRQSEGHSFGDLERLVAIASRTSEGKLEHGALRLAVQQVPSSSSEWLTTAGHHALINRSGGLYDDLLEYFATRERH